jgi:hypothetical protein
LDAERAEILQDQHKKIRVFRKAACSRRNTVIHDFLLSCHTGFTAVPLSLCEAGFFHFEEKYRGIILSSDPVFCA